MVMIRADNQGQAQIWCDQYLGDRVLLNIQPAESIPDGPNGPDLGLAVARDPEGDGFDVSSSDHNHNDELDRRLAEHIPGAKSKKVQH